MKSGDLTGFPAGAWRALPALVLVLWLIHLGWLAWHFAPEVKDLMQRLGEGSGGEAVRREDPLYRWLLRVKEVMPPEASYFMLDHYEAGKEIEVRYHLFPRRHHLALPDCPPSRLFHLLKYHEAAFLLVREPRQAEGPGLLAAREAKAAVPLSLPGPGLLFALRPEEITNGFYD